MSKKEERWYNLEDGVSVARALGRIEGNFHILLWLVMWQARLAREYCQCPAADIDPLKPSSGR